MTEDSVQEEQPPTRSSGLEPSRSNRREFVRKIVGIAAAGGLAGVLAGQARLPSVRAADGDPLTIGQINYGTNTTDLYLSGATTALTIDNGYGLGGGWGISSRGDPALNAQLLAQNSSGAAIIANGTFTVSGNGVGVKAITDGGCGVLGISQGSGSVLGLAQGVVGITERGQYDWTLPSRDTIGVEGLATTGKGVVGTSTFGYGVMGASKSTSATSGFSQGVVGVTEDTILAGYGNIGVQGLATTGIGVEGRSFFGKGVHGWSLSGTGVHGEAYPGSGPGVKGESTGGFGVLGVSNVTGSGSFAQGVVGLTDGLAPPGPAPIGVEGAATTGVGLFGTSMSGGIGVLGMSWGDPGGKPIAARGWWFQTANLQEWQDVFGNPMSVVDATGRLGIGTSSPGSPVEVAGLVKASLGTAKGQPAINASSLLCAAQDTWTVGEFSSHSTSGNPQFYFYISGRGCR